jgi:hypothetical protein
MVNYTNKSIQLLLLDEKKNPQKIVNLARKLQTKTADF